MMDQLIMVDAFDKVIGGMEKMEAHRKPVLHRAFSVFLYRDNQLLLQKRAEEKYHSGGLWANSCCSHPRVGETVLAAAQRRLPEELGCTASLTEIGSFVYFHRFAEDLFEYEYDHVLVGQYDGSITPNPQEIAQVKWMDVTELAAGLLIEPEQYCPWFRTAAPMVLRWLAQNCG